MTSQNGQIKIEWEDVERLTQVNPLASEQLKNIAMQRMMAELERRLAEATDGQTQSDEREEGKVVPLKGGGKGPKNAS